MLALVFWGLINQDANENDQSHKLPGNPSTHATILQAGPWRLAELEAPHLSRQEPHVANTGLYTKSFLPGRKH